VAALAAALDGFGVGFDDDEGEVTAGELAGDLLADAAEAAEDVVVFEALDLTAHSLYPQERAELAFQGELEEAQQCVEYRADAGYGEEHGEDAAGGVEGADLAEADGHDGGDGHVEGVDEAPAFDDHVGGGADDGDDDEEDGGVDKVAGEGGEGGAEGGHGRGFGTLDLGLRTLDWG